MAEFKTPVMKRIKRCHVPSPSVNSPKFVIPPSPCMKQLGYGTGVNVYLMERFSPLHGSYKSPWAVKKLNKEVHDDEGKFTKRLSFEAEILKSLQHPNIIGYRSYSKKDGAPCLVMESGESCLLNMIETREEQELGPVPAKDILKVAGDIASALKYLHEDRKLLHGDIKSANILIKGEFEVAKLCDFGVSLKLDDEGVALKGEEYIGTELWSSKEAIHMETITHKSDIFSFGLVLWEMLSLTVPHLPIMDTSDLDEQSFLEDESSEALGTRPPLPDFVLGDDYIPVLEIFYACTEIDAAKRPSASQILSILKYGKDTEATGKDESGKESKENEDTEMKESKEDESKTAEKIEDSTEMAKEIREEGDGKEEEKIAKKDESTEIMDEVKAKEVTGEGDGKEDEKIAEKDEDTEMKESKEEESTDGVDEAKKDENETENKEETSPKKCPDDEKDEKTCLKENVDTNEKKSCSEEMQVEKKGADDKVEADNKENVV